MCRNEQVGRELSEPVVRDRAGLWGGVGRVRRSASSLVGVLAGWLVGGSAQDSALGVGRLAGLRVGRKGAVENSQTTLYRQRSTDDL